MLSPVSAGRFGRRLAGADAASFALSIYLTPVALVVLGELFAPSFLIFVGAGVLALAALLIAGPLLVACVVLSETRTVRAFVRLVALAAWVFVGLVLTASALFCGPVSWSI